MEAPLLSASGEANRTFGFESNKRQSW